MHANRTYSFSYPPMRIVIFCILCVLFDTVLGQRVLMRDLPVVTGYRGQNAQRERTPVQPQLQCKGGDACGYPYWQPDVIQCRNQAWDGAKTHWLCEGTHSPNVRLGGSKVRCEGWDRAGDDFVALSSCVIDYELFLVPQPPPPPPPIVVMAPPPPPPPSTVYVVVPPPLPPPPPPVVVMRPPPPSPSPIVVVAHPSPPPPPPVVVMRPPPPPPPLPPVTSSNEWMFNYFLVTILILFLLSTCICTKSGGQPSAEEVYRKYSRPPNPPSDPPSRVQPSPPPPSDPVLRVRSLPLQPPSPQLPPAPILLVTEPLPVPISIVASAPPIVVRQREPFQQTNDGALTTSKSFATGESE